MIKRTEIKNKARKILDTNTWKFIKPLLIIFTINIVLSFLLSKIVPTDVYNIGKGIYKTQLHIADLIVSILIAPLYVGYSVYILNLIRNKKFKIKDIFSKMNYVFPIWGVTIIVNLFTSIGTVLLILPGIIIALMLSMTTYVMADGEINVLKVLKSSKELTEGYKKDLFVFILSFIGWYIFIIVTLGIGSIYVVPYLKISFSLYYEELIKLKKQK